MFFEHYYAYSSTNLIEDSIFDYYYEAAIEFIGNIGNKHDWAGEIKTEGSKEEELHNSQSFS